MFSTEVRQVLADPEDQRCLKEVKEHVEALLEVEGNKMLAKNLDDMTESEILRSWLGKDNALDCEFEKLKKEEPQFYAGFRYGLFYGWWQALGWLEEGMCFDPVTDNGILPFWSVIDV